MVTTALGSATGLLASPIACAGIAGREDAATAKGFVACPAGAGDCAFKQMLNPTTSPMAASCGKEIRMNPPDIAPPGRLARHGRVYRHSGEGNSGQMDLKKLFIETAADAVFAPPNFQAIQEADLIRFPSENPAKSGLFAGIFGHFSCIIPPFSAEIRSFTADPFLHCGILCAFSRTSKIFPESEFCSAKTRGFFTYVTSFSFPKAN
ncbi:MAG: hypothetical protein ABR990_00385 [Terracidiphilus sp.]|jgi:hypothetical protein